MSVWLLRQVRRVENKHGCPVESDYHCRHPGGDAALVADVRRRLWWRELGVMVAENGVFVSFLLGMTSALPS